MNAKSWAVCVIEPNKYEGQIILELLRGVGAANVKLFTSQDEATHALRLHRANIIVTAFEAGPLDGAAWTKAFRRSNAVANRQAAIFVTSGAFSRSMAEQCRLAGANALIGKPVSGKTLIATIKRVLARPRPFVDGEGYVGPCRRAGIVTAGAPKRRRRSDGQSEAPPAGTLQTAIQALIEATALVSADPAKADACGAALRAVQGYAVNVGDGPLMRACAAFSLQLSAARTQRPEAAKAALEMCIGGVARLAAISTSEGAAREALAEDVRQAVAKAVMQRVA
ncbi:MAG: hypothetical protein KJZ75_03365 [Hyphomonadaceae bacterium]|nr:hypothetical protein [Hyphomonadaceae bacterium]GIK50666.1 MAG: hypothetical protein BroJett013_33630 [Alphaproteobacteria bacterium]